MSEKSMLFRGSRPGTPKVEAEGFARASLGTSVTHGLHRDRGRVAFFRPSARGCRQCRRAERNLGAGEEVQTVRTAMRRGFWRDAANSTRRA